MARASASDPIRNFKFQVEISTSATSTNSPWKPETSKNIANLGFSVVSGVSVSNEMITYREGGMNTHMHKMPGQSDFGPITLSKGMISGENELYSWQQLLHSWSAGGDVGTSGEGRSKEGGKNDFRCDAIVKVYDHPVTHAAYYDGTSESRVNDTALGFRIPKFAFKVFNCWPASYSFTDLNAGDSSIMIQQLVLNHEGFLAAFTAEDIKELQTA